MLTLLAVSPFLAILSAPTTACRVVSMGLNLDLKVSIKRTDGMYAVVLEQRTDHGITYHHRRYLKSLKFQSGQTSWHE